MKNMCPTEKSGIRKAAVGSKYVCLSYTGIRIPDICYLVQQLFLQCFDAVECDSSRIDLHAIAQVAYAFVDNSFAWIQT
jgi:hypothetical protein